MKLTAISLLPIYESLATLPSGDGQYVYVLKLQEDKYYVGYTTNISRRVVQHMLGQGQGSLWTKRYKPIEVIKCLTFRNQDKALEGEKRVTMFMARRGLAVRGGPWTQCEPPKTMQELEERQKRNELVAEAKKKQYRQCQQWLQDQPRVKKSRSEPFDPTLL